MSEQHDADNKQSFAQSNDPILVNKQGEAKVSPEQTDQQPASASKTSVNPPSDKTMSADMSQQSYSSPATQNPIIVKSGIGKGLAVGALVLSILALGASGFLFVEGQNQLKMQQLKYDQKIDSAGIGASKTAAVIENSLVHIDDLTRQVRLLQQQQNTQGNNITRLDTNYQQLIRSRTDWLVDEVEATLNLAAQQLIISGNVSVAIGVLEDLDSRLARFDQPQLLTIKKAISNDLADLKSKPYLDIASASLRLNRLETAVASLPLTIDDQLQPGTRQTAYVENPNAKWWQRAWSHTVYVLQGMIEVRHVDSNDSMLMSPQQMFFVRENLRLRLLDARLALIQRSSEVYSTDLNSAEAAVKQYFDGNSVTTQSWLKELAQLKLLNVQNSHDANVLTNSLTAIRQYQKQNNMDTAPVLPDLGVSLSASESSASAPVENEAQAASDSLQSGNQTSAQEQMPLPISVQNGRA